MDNLVGRKVVIARLHGTVHIAGLGQVGPTLDTAHTANKGQMDLTLTEFGVLCKGKGPTGINFEFLVPSAMCMSIQLAPETPAPAKK